MQSLLLTQHDVCCCSCHPEVLSQTANPQVQQHQPAKAKEDAQQQRVHSVAADGTNA
jgi:hypothetical protein